MDKIKENDQLIIYLDRPLSSFNQSFFIKCFTPILSSLANNLYLALHAFVKPSLLESDQIAFKKLMQNLNIKKTDELLNARRELEALGLIKTYIKRETDSFYVIVLNDLPTPFNVLNNSFYKEALISKIGIESYNDLIKEYLVHSRNLDKMEEITTALDECFTNTDNDVIWQANLVDVNIKENHFDYDYIRLVLASIVDDKQLNSVEFYQQINRLAWIFALGDDDIIEACKNSIKDGLIDYELLRTNFKKQVKQEFKLRKLNIEEKSTSKLINSLNNCSPSVIVKNKFHTSLTPSEMEMFDKLMINTNISQGVLNSLIIYVMGMKNGEIPSYNYFLKIANTWIRKGVKRTEDALAIVNGEKDSTKNKKQTEWYQAYQDELKQKEDAKEKEETSLEELEEFFKNR